MIPQGINFPSSYRVAGFERSPEELNELDEKLAEISRAEHQAERDSRSIIVGTSTVRAARTMDYIEPDKGEQ